MKLALKKLTATRSALRPRGSMRSEKAQAALVLLAALLVYFWKLWLGHVLSANDILYFYPPWSAVRPPSIASAGNDLLSDFPLQHYPYQAYVKDSLRSGHMPLWNPYIFAGAPFLANSQSAVFYPLNVLFHILPVEVAFGIAAAARLFIAGFGTYLFARALELKHVPALASALAFMFSSYNVVWLMYPISNVVTLFPLLMFATEKIFSSDYKFYAFLLALLSWMQFLGGNAENSFHNCVGVGLYFLFRLASDCPGHRSLGAASRRLLLFALAQVLGFLAASAALFPFLEALLPSHTFNVRSSFSENIFFLKPVFLIALLIPDFFGNPADGNYWGGTFYSAHAGYVGVLPLFLSLVALFYKRRCKTVVFWGCFSLFSLFIAFKVEPLYWLVTSLPFFKQAVNLRLVYFHQFAVALLTAIALQSLAGGDFRPKSLSALTGLIALGFIAFATMAWLNRDALHVPGSSALQAYVSRKLLWFAALSAASAAMVMLFGLNERAQTRSRLSALALGFIFLDLFAFGNKFNPTLERRRSLPAVPKSIAMLKSQASSESSDGLFRIAAIGRFVFPTNANMIYGLQDVRGYDFPVPRRTHVFFERLVRHVSGDDHYFITDINSDNLRFLSLLGVKYVLSPGGWKPGLDALERVYDGEVAIYRNERALPRAFMVYRAIYAQGEEEALRLLQDPGLDLSSVVVIEGDSPPETSVDLSLRARPQVQIVKYQPNRVRIKAATSAPGFLVLADSFAPGWRAEIDGRPCPIYIADYLLRAVYLESGEHEVEFYYAPLSFKFGCAVSLLSIMLILIGLGKHRGNPPLRADKIES